MLGNYPSFLSGICSSSFPDLFKKKNKPHNSLNLVVLCKSTDTVIGKEKKNSSYRNKTLEFKLFNKSDGVVQEKNLNLRKH